MDGNSPAGQVDPASVVGNRVRVVAAKGRSQPTHSTSVHSINYQAADLFGRCVLRVCYWAEIFLSFTRGSESAQYKAPPKPANRPPLHPATASLSDFISERAGCTLTGSSDRAET